jgi:hypothetical protein
MKIILQINFLILIVAGILLAGDTAYPLENGQRQMGVFQPRIYGINNNLEISTHPLLFFVKPNIKLKKFYREINGFGLASRYSFDYPTLLLRILQKEGIGGLLSNPNDVGKVPHLLVLQGELLATKIFEKSHVTGKLGMSTCLGCKLDSRHLFDYDLLYPRMALYHYGIGANMGLDLDYIYSEKISLKVDMDLLFLPQERAFIEHKFLFYYSLSSKYTLSGGYKFCYGYYPFSKEQGLWNLFPLIDLSWKWEK